MLIPTKPKIYHIVHIDKLAHIVRDGNIWCDAKMAKRAEAGTAIGIPSIKQRRLTNELDSHPGLHVGDCVPFYYCHRSVMLYIISRANHPDLPYRGGQDPIVHLEADFHSTVAWADSHTRRWAFTASNAGASYFQDYSNQSELNKLDWDAILSRNWQGRQEWKQAEFLIERSFPWALVLRIGVKSRSIGAQVHRVLQESTHRPSVEIKPSWYY